MSKVGAITEIYNLKDAWHNSRRVLRSLTIIVFLTIAAGICAGQQRPLMTDDIDITPSGAFEVSAGVDFLQNAKFPLSGIKGDQTRVGVLRLRTGLAANVEIQVEGSLYEFVAINSRSTSPIPLNINGNSTSDFGDITLSTKIKLVNATKHMPAFGLKFGFQLPNTDQAKGVGTNQLNVFGKVIVQKGFGSVLDRVSRFNLVGNLGMTIMTDPLERFSQNDLLLYGLSGTYRVNRRINIVGEVNGRQNTRAHGAPIGTESIGQFRIGTQIRASGLRFDTAAVFGLTRNSPRTGVTFGVTYLSPPIFKPAK